MKHTATTQQPRKPTTSELRQLIEYEAKRTRYANDPIDNQREAAFVVSGAYIAVFDDFATGGPGWFGKIMVVVWDGGPSQYEVYKWENDQFIHVDQQFEL